MDEDVGGDPIAFRIAIFRWQAHRGIRQPFQHQALAFDGRQRRGAVENIGVHLSGSTFVQETNRRFDGIAAQKIDLDAVFLLKCLGGRPSELIDDLGRIPNHLTFLFRRVDQRFVGGLG